MTRKIFNSIFFASITVFLVSIILICGVLFEYFVNVQKSSLTEQVNIITAEYNNIGSKYLKSFSSDTYRITLIAPDGKVISDTVKNPEKMENHADRPEVKSALLTGIGSSERYSNTLLEKTYYYAKKLDSGNVIRISTTRKSVWILFLGLLQPIAAVLIITFILSLVLSSRLAGRIVKPLKTLDLEHPLENDTYDELSAVLSKIDRQRKELARRTEMLSHRQDEFSSVTQNMNEGLILIGKNNEILSINRAAAKIFSVDSELTGKNIITVSRSPEIRKVTESAASGHAFETVFTLSGREYQLNANPVIIGEKIGGACILIFDVTEKTENERIRREFTANVSHELKTPLHSIMGAAELLKNNLVKPEDKDSFTDRIYNESSRLVTLVDDIIRLSQLDEGDAPAMTVVNLKNAADEAADAVKSEAEKRNITVSVSGEDVSVPGVPRLIYEIAYNLCDNAVRYNTENGKVDVKVSLAENRAVLTVSDTGIGVPEDSIERIFERFYRVDKSHSRETGGTGLGLSIVKHAAEFLGAEISVKSTLGKGTEISVSFPMEI